MKKTFLVVTAMPEEIEGLFSEVKPIDFGNGSYLYENKDFSVHALLGGIGKVSMAYRLGKFLSGISADEIINVGVAGTLSPKLKPLETLLATKCAYHDVDLTAFGYPIGQMSKEPLYFEADEEGIEIGENYPGGGIKKGLILSGDQFITKKNLPSSFYEDFEDPLACDMESAAVAQVAHEEGVPFLIIRSISDDTSSQDNKTDYEKRLKEACKKAGKIAWYILRQKVKEEKTKKTVA